MRKLLLVLLGIIIIVLIAEIGIFTYFNFNNRPTVALDNKSSETQTVAKQDDAPKICFSKPPTENIYNTVLIENLLHTTANGANVIEKAMITHIYKGIVDSVDNTGGEIIVNKEKYPNSPINSYRWLAKIYWHNEKPDSNNIFIIEEPNKDKFSYFLEKEGTLSAIDLQSIQPGDSIRIEETQTLTDLQCMAYTCTEAVKIIKES